MSKLKISKKSEIGGPTGVLKVCWDDCSKTGISPTRGQPSGPVTAVFRLSLGDGGVRARGSVDGGSALPLEAGEGIPDDESGPMELTFSESPVP